MSTYRVEKQSYSHGAWRVLDAATDEKGHLCVPPKHRRGRYQHTPWICSCGRAWLATYRSEFSVEHAEALPLGWWAWREWAPLRVAPRVGGGMSAEQRWYEVEMTGDVREVYSVQASSEEDARERWAEGDLVLSEASGMEFYSVREATA